MTTKPVHQLLYRSAAAHSLSDSELTELVVQAQTNNLKYQITGMLIYSDGMFVQILEGDRETVRKVYRIIQEDDRHHAVTCLGERPMATREFEDWAMGWEKISGKIPDGLTDIAKPLTPADVKQFNTLGGYQLLRTVDKFEPDNSEQNQLINAELSVPA